MTRFVLAICGERYDGGWHVRRYAYLDDLHEGEKPRETREALGYMRRLMPIDGVGSWVVGELPPKEYQRFFDVYVRVGAEENDALQFSRGVDFFKYAGCPAEAIKDGMDIYGAIRKFGVRPANKAELKKRKRKAQERRERRAQMEQEKSGNHPKPKETKPIFVAGQTYVVELVDRFGYMVRHDATVKEIYPDRKKMEVTFHGGSMKKPLTSVCKIMRYDDGAEYCWYGEFVFKASFVKQDMASTVDV